MIKLRIYGQHPLLRFRKVTEASPNLSLTQKRGLKGYGNYDFPHNDMTIMRQVKDVNRTLFLAPCFRADPLAI